MNGETILMIEDNHSILSNNREIMELEGARVLSAGNLADGRKLAERERIDLILLDIMLPDGSGLEYCRQLRGESNIPILFLSALNTSEDVVAGLLSGGDGYIVKPYKNSELIAYVEALLRRSRMMAAPLHFGCIELQFAPRRALVDGIDVILKPMEFSMLEYLVRHAGEYIPAAEIYCKIWGESADNLRTVHNHIYNLREKLDGSGVVVTHKRGLGYKISTI